MERIGPRVGHDAQVEAGNTTRPRSALRSFIECERIDDPAGECAYVFGRDDNACVAVRDDVARVSDVGRHRWERV